VLSVQTVLMQSVNAAILSGTLLKQAQSFVMSSQSDDSARPYGCRQLKTQGACEITAGNAVIVYGTSELTAAVALSDDWASPEARKREKRMSFIVTLHRSKKLGIDYEKAKISALGILYACLRIAQQDWTNPVGMSKFA
jgi:hypothetical protein